MDGQYVAIGFAISWILLSLSLIEAVAAFLLLNFLLLNFIRKRMMLKRSDIDMKGLLRSLHHHLLLLHI